MDTAAELAKNSRSSASSGENAASRSLSTLRQPITPASLDDGDRELRPRLPPARHVAPVHAHVGGVHHLPRVDDVADDALAGSQHGVVRGRVVEADLHHPGDQVGVRAPDEGHRPVEDEDAGRVVGDRRAEGLQQVLEDHLQVERPADPLRELEEQAVPAARR